MLPLQKSLMCDVSGFASPEWLTLGRDYSLDFEVCDRLASRICDRCSDYCVGMLVHRVGSDWPVRVGLTYRRGRTDWERPLLYSERCDSPAVEHVFSCALGCFDIAFSSPADFCQVCVNEANDPVAK